MTTDLVTVSNEVTGRLIMDQTTTPSAYPEHWKNDFDDLKCHYINDSYDGKWVDIWTVKNLGYETELLSHVCLNGTFKNLSFDEWNERCFPNYWGNLGWRRSARVWSLFNFIVGLVGNLLTLVAIPYAKSKNR